MVLGTAAVYSAGHATIGLLLLMIPVAAEAVISRRIPWRRGALDPYLAAFVLVLTISGVLSPYRSVAAGAAVLAALTIYLSYGVVYQVQKRDDRFIHPLLWSWFAGGVGAAALVIYFLLVWGGPKATLSALGPNALGGPKATLPALGPNALGSTFLIALMIGIGLVLNAPFPLRYAAGAGTLVVALALALTLSRGAWIGTACALVVLVVLLRGRRPRPSGAGSRRIWPAMLVFAAALIVMLALLDGEAAIIRKSLISITDLEQNRDRIFLARSALAIAADHPLVGSGLNTFVRLHPHPSLGERGRKSEPQSFAHNIFLNMVAEGGILGLGAFIALLIRGAVGGWRWCVASTGRDRITSAAVLAAFAGLLVHQQFDGTVQSVHISVGLWLLLAIMMANEPPGRPAAPDAGNTIDVGDAVALAVDPGREKCGIAVLAGGRVLARRVVQMRDLGVTAARWSEMYGVNRVALGDKTGREEARALLAAALPSVPIVMVDEAGTTEAARARYFAEHPPRGWRRLIPQSMLVPPEPYDDYVAILLAEKLLGRNANIRPPE